MALSDREREVLEEMERRFYQSEADVVEPRAASGVRINYRTVLVGVLVLLLGVGVLVAGVAMRQPLVGVVGFCVMVVGVWYMLRPGAAGEQAGQSAATSAGPARGSKQSAKAGSGGFARRFEERWERRMDGEL